MVIFGADIDGLVQDCSNSSALAMELLQSCIKPSIFAWRQFDNDDILSLIRKSVRFE